MMRCPVLLLSGAVLLALVGCTVGTVCTDAHGEDGLNLSGGDLPGSPHRLSSAKPALCAAMCNSTAACQIWVYHKAECSPGVSGPHPLCWLKTTHTRREGNPCTCSGAKGGGSLPPAPPSPPQPPVPSSDLGACPLRSVKKAPKGARNVLYILVDDLRPSLSPYGQTQVHTPNIQKLADGATVFLRAYCQEAVCSPSRNSFLSGKRHADSRPCVWAFLSLHARFVEARTSYSIRMYTSAGRRPDHTRAWNFVNHFVSVYVLYICLVGGGGGG
jgi:hypothetical protein